MYIYLSPRYGRARPLRKVDGLKEDGLKEHGLKEYGLLTDDDRRQPTDLTVLII